MLKSAVQEQIIRVHMAQLYISLAQPPKIVNTDLIKAMVLLLLYWEDEKMDMHWEWNVPKQS